jgi:two-component system LytT family response regulator
MVIRTLIVDDERAERRSMRSMLRSDADIRVVGECDSGVAAVATIRRLQPELLVLAIGLPDVDGVSVLADLGVPSRAIVVFTSTSDRDVLRAFQAHATDYLVKPISEDRFRLALQTAKRRVWESRVESWARLGPALAPSSKLRAGAPDDSVDRSLLVIAIREGRVLLKQREVSWVGAEGDYVGVHVGRTTHTVRSTLGRFVGQLDSGLFAQIHRSTFVNLQGVRELQRSYRHEYVVILFDGTRLKVSRRYHPTLESRLAFL